MRGGNAVVEGQTDGGISPSGWLHHPRRLLPCAVVGPRGPIRDVLIIRGSLCILVLFLALSNNFAIDTWRMAQFAGFARIDTIAFDLPLPALLARLGDPPA